MKQAVNMIRFLVGVLFIFSGLVKANDPLGLGYKMDEFFDLWNEGLVKTSFSFIVPFFEFLRAHSLTLSVIMIAFEIIAGVALLIGWRMRVFSWLLLLLTIFFTFLTAYAVYSGKFTNCGCFGDCLPIPPTASFLKDILLTVLIVFLFINRRQISPVLRERTNVVIMIAAMAISFGLQWYVLTYLPIVDCLPYKKNNNIAGEMKAPAGSRPDSFATTLIYKNLKTGQEKEFLASGTEYTSSNIWKDSSWKFEKMNTRLIRKGNAEPPIKGFVLKTEAGDDSTQMVLSQPYCFLLFCENFRTPVTRWQQDFATLKRAAEENHVPVYLVTASLNEARKAIAHTSFWQMQVFECDFTAIRTAARTNPCLYLLKEGTVIDKWSNKRIPAAVKAIPRDNNR